MSTVTGQLAGPATISGQLDLAFDPAELRDADGEWRKLYHASPFVFKPGDLITPGHQQVSGTVGRVPVPATDPPKVYFTDNLGGTKIFRSNVYQVAPQGDVATKGNQRRPIMGSYTGWGPDGTSPPPQGRHLAGDTIGGQLDLAGWDTAWLHEDRGRGGQWVKNLPGGYTQATFPGMPRGSLPPAWEEAARQLDADQAAGIKSETKPHAKRGMDNDFFGNSADTSVVTFSNGHKWVRKRGLPPEEYENEVLAARVSDAIGAGAPEAITHGEGDHTELWEPFLKGAKAAIEWEGGQDEYGDPIDNDPQDMYDTPGGVRIGILDNLTDNGDRHEGNWMVKRDRKTGQDSPLPIDHGRVQFGDTTAYGAGAFGENLANDSLLLGEVPQAEWDTWAGKLGALQDSFSELGRDGDYQQMMANFSYMQQMAAAARSVP